MTDFTRTDFNAEDPDRRIILDYTSRDWAAIRSQLVGMAKGLIPEWETVGEEGDFGTQLLELFAYMGDVQHFYIDRVASEPFLGSALRRESVLYIADMLGYKPVGQHAASVVLEFTLDENAEGDITLPAGTRIQTEADNANDVVAFTLDSAVNLYLVESDPPDEGQTAGQRSQNKIGYATEGIIVEQERLGVSYGAPLSEYVLPSPGVVANSVKITSREAGQIVTWDYVTDISLARPTQSAFTTFLDDLDNTHVVFGDNASGRIPPVDAELFVSYRVGVGAVANDIGISKIKRIIPPPELSDQIWAVTVTNPDNPLGGTDVESADSMRYSIPRSSRIRNRALTLTDYADMALQVPGVSKSTAYGIVYTGVHVRIAPIDGVANTDTMAKLIADVEQYMSDKVLVGSQIVVEPDDIEDLWQDVHIRVKVQVQPAYNRTTVRQEVDRILREVLSFDNMDFAERVSKGLIYRTVLAIPGVEWAELEHLSGTAPADETDLTTTPDVDDIVTTSLLIPKIYQYPNTDPKYITDSRGLIQETETDFPAGTYPYLAEEEERQHDGLWVRAEGGLANT